MDSQGIRQQSQLCGFNLIESAIVLGVIGLIIGGIWVSAAAMYESYKVNETAKGFLLSATRFQNLVSLREAKQQWGCSHCSINADIRRLGIPPKEWIKGSRVISPLGLEMNVSDNSNYFSPSVPEYNETFWLGQEAMPPHLCIKFVVALSKTNPEKNMRSGLTSIYVRDNVTNSAIGRITCYNFPISPQTAETLCTSTENNVGAIYPYTRPN